MNVIKFPKPKGSPCPICKKWVNHDMNAAIRGWDWHECVDHRPKIKEKLK